MKRLLLPLAVALAHVSAWAAPGDDEVLRIANDSGCMACHQVEKGSQSPKGIEGSEPLAPAWRDIAARYKSVKGAQQQLTATIMTGSSAETTRSTPYQSHWTGKVSGPFMPSHRVAISEADAARMVAWILALEVTP